ncbi:uncharacterized protein KD926_003037 [Aspergillus affinis]|uniref:uncharacterized protein n=1 Tax=Aspergillus affinis TaxID=1070780 RepID=UPI0022FEA35A|nr:uncharacterized protein KD926_003037 [Aspergillus affinis]KAI9043687.1 hypothetical protein KD926_003037 [Aspergillus affinis]
MHPGIYIPVAHQDSEDYPEVCTFLQVNFASNREVNMLTQFELDATLGLAPDAKWTMAINIRQLVNLLSLPRQMRGHNCFSSHIVRMVDRKLTPTTGIAQKSTDGRPDLSWTTVASANYGLSIQWKPPTPTIWLADFIRNSLTVAVGFIPVIGPLAAVCFPLTWTAIADPSNFEHTLRELAPVVDLAMQVAAEVQKSAQEQVLYMPKGWAGNVEHFRLITAAEAETEKKTS